ncbi:MAG: hypothetical protein Q9188_002739 [Gyalolechia gomerana]
MPFFTSYQRVSSSKNSIPAKWTTVQGVEGLGLTLIFQDCPFAEVAREASGRVATFILAFLNITAKEEGRFLVRLHSCHRCKRKEIIHVGVWHGTDDAERTNDVPVCTRILLAKTRKGPFLRIIEVVGEVLWLEIRLNIWRFTAADMPAVVIPSSLKQDTFRLNVGKRKRTENILEDWYIGFNERIRRLWVHGRLHCDP